ncbi:hypothetical protein ATCC90586_001252 [Pythium insidiosum]|nr:hypothetical protein ATCC90586_001252 [Pythium insidiosum]
MFQLMLMLREETERKAEIHREAEERRMREEQHENELKRREEKEEKDVRRREEKEEKEARRREEKEEREERRRQGKQDAEERSHARTQEMMMLISALLQNYFTWERLYEEMLLGVAVSMVRRAKPSEATFRQTVQKLNQMRTGNVTEIAELIGHHAAAAKAMRMEYNTDIEAASDRSLVLTMDYSQNIALPHVAETPSQWYFLSLIAVSVFGIHDANQQRQTNYIYTERKGGKGSNEVVSMLQRYLGVDPQHATLTVYTDNCGGQNKNNYVIKYLLFLAHTGQFEEVNYKFFIRGHTKNACDRGFGAMKKKLAREDCWTVEQLCEALKKASISTDTVTLEQEEAPFLAYKDVFNELYKNLPAIQKYQLFKMTTSNPGVGECRESPSTPVFSFDLRREYDRVRVTLERARELFDSAEPVPQPTPNPEKIRDIHTSVTAYVPAEFRDNVLYAAPSDAQVAAAKAIKKKPCCSDEIIRYDPGGFGVRTPQEKQQD